MLAACAVSPSYTNSTSQGADRAHRYSLCSFRWRFSEHVFWTASYSPGGANLGVRSTSTKMRAIAAGEPSEATRR